MKRFALVANNLISNIAVWNGVTTWQPSLPKGEIYSEFNPFIGQAFKIKSVRGPINIAIDGNSICLGYNSGEFSGVNQGVIDCGLTSDDFINMAYNGAPTSDLRAMASNRIDPLYDSLATHNISIIMEGGNDIANGRTDVQAYGELKTYGQARKAKGWKTIFATIPPRAALAAANQETYRLSVNTMIRDAKAANETWIDAIADIGAHEILGNVSNCTNTTYFTDRVHFTILGQQMIAPIFTAAINAIRGV